MSAYTPTPEEMTRDIVAAAKFVFDINLSPKEWSVSTERIKDTWRYERASDHISLLFNGGVYPIKSAEGWREVIGAMLARIGVITVIAEGTTLVRTNSVFNKFNFPREITYGDRKIIVYRLADIKKTYTIRTLRERIFTMKLTPAIESIVGPFRAEWEVADATLKLPAPVTLERLLELKQKPAGNAELDAIVGPLPVDLAEAIDRWYSAACLRYVTARANYAAEREAAQKKIADVAEKLIAAADAQKWYIDGELVSAADVPI